MSGILPNGKQQFIDSNGNPLASGKVYYYIPSTTTFKNTYQDPALTILNTNPIQLDANGQCIAYGSGSYRQQVYDVNNNLIWDQESDAPTNLSDVEALYSAPNGSSLIGYDEGQTGAISRTAQSKFQEIVSVLDFGADPTGATDSTIAFRNACQSTVPYSSVVEYRAIYIPPGRYKITDTVYVRAGNCLYGAGQSASYIDASSFGVVTYSVFKLGWGLINGVPTSDSTYNNQPPEIKNMFILGGPSGGGAAVDLEFPGGMVHDMWFSACGLGVMLGGGYLYDCQFDGGLEGISIVANNQAVDNCQFFNQNYNITINTSASDCSITNCSFQYPKYNAIGIFASNSRNLKIQDCDFFMNVQYTTFNGYIVLFGSGVSVNVNGCTFGNQYGFAVRLDTSGSNDKTLNMHDCVFQGLSSYSGYAQSTTAGGILVSSGNAYIQGCNFQNLQNYVLQLGQNGYACNVEMQGCIINNTTNVSNNININSATYGDYLILSDIVANSLNLFNANQYLYPICRNLTNWLTIASNGTVNYVQIPIVFGALIDFSMTANPAISGAFQYRKSKRLLIDVYTDYNGTTQETYLTQTTLDASPAGVAGALTLTPELNSVGGGTTSVPPLVGYAVVSWPQNYAISSLDVQIC